MKESFLGVKFPFFMPDATLGVVKSLTTSQLESTNTEIVVVNTLHLLLSLGIERLRTFGGIKELMDWKGKVVSDSGGFQVFSLIHRNSKMGKITQFGAYFKSPIDGSQTLLTPEISIDMQIALDSDVLVVLDDCRGSGSSDSEIATSVDRTTSWAKRAKDHFEKKYPNLVNTKKLFAVVQGGESKRYRELSFNQLADIGFDGYGFGGWPIDSESNLLEDVLEFTADLMPNDKPKYAMGVGTPEDIKRCSEFGFNMFDCVIPTRNARHGLLYTSSGKLRITQAQYRESLEVIDPSCDCELCSRYNRGYLHHLFRSNESTAKSLATIHNISYYNHMMSILQNA